jgi:hypothetical protein
MDLKNDMGKLQNKVLGVRAQTYELVRRLCFEKRIKMIDFVEEAIREKLEKENGTH